jgi:hypothetical protein
MVSRKAAKKTGRDTRGYREARNFLFFLNIIKLLVELIINAYWLPPSLRLLRNTKSVTIHIEKLMDIYIFLSENIYQLVSIAPVSCKYPYFHVNNRI